MDLNTPPPEFSYYFYMAKRVTVNSSNIVRTDAVQGTGNAVVQTFMAVLPDRIDGLVVINRLKKLKAIDVLLNGSAVVAAVLDEGLKIEGLNKNIREKLGLAVSADHLVRIESANGWKSTSLQVVKDAAYKMLLGFPFHVLTQLASLFFEDRSSHITLTDPNTGVVISKMPPRERIKPEACGAETHMSMDF